jgi:hypothetical protein
MFAIQGSNCRPETELSLDRKHAVVGEVGVGDGCQIQAIKYLRWVYFSAWREESCNRCAILQVYRLRQEDARLIKVDTKVG